MKHLTLLIALITFLSDRYACTCTGASEYSEGERSIEWYNKHDYVFEALIDSVHTQEYQQLVFLSVKKIYKGNLPDHLIISPPLFGSSCSFDLRGEEGRIFIVYGYQDSNGNINTHFCNGTKRLYTIKELDTLKIENWQKKLKKQELMFLKRISEVSIGKVSGKYSNGKLSGKGYFENGVPISRWVYYGYDGSKVAEGNYIEGKKDGEWIEYKYSSFDSNNKYPYYSIGIYKNGLKEGEWKVYKTNGDYAYSEIYNDGNCIIK